MLNNSATTYLLLQNGINSSAHSNVPMTPIQNLLIGGPLLLCLLVLSIGLVADCVFGSERAFDICLKIVSISILVSIIGLIVSIFV